jgi:hypothetical protein
MNNRDNDGRLTKLLRVLAVLVGIPCLIGSAKLSVAGVNLGGDLWWMGWVIAAAFTLSQFIVNGSYEKELNWTILVLGVGSYGASIWMNILGIYDYRLTEIGSATTVDFWYVMSEFDLGVIMLAIFIDAFPEMALRWALGESRVGDWVGNMVKTYQHPEMLTKSLTVSSPNVRVTPKHNGGKNRREELEREHRRPAPAPKFTPRDVTDDDEEEDEDDDMPKFTFRNRN